MTSVETARLLSCARDGDRRALDELFTRVYEELRRIAHRRLARRRAGATLETTALVHEAYLKLVDPAGVACRDRSHFLALASRAMRFVLVDHARSRSAGKRGGGEPALRLGDLQLAADERAADLLALDEALERLALSSARLAQLVELRFFGGLTYEEIAEATGWSVPTIKRDWVRARAWLHRSLHAPAHR